MYDIYTVDSNFPVSESLAKIYLKKIKSCNNTDGFPLEESDKIQAIMVYENGDKFLWWRINKEATPLRWTPAEEKFLIDNKGSMKLSKIAKFLNKTYQAVTAKSSRMNRNVR